MHSHQVPFGEAAPEVLSVLVALRNWVPSCFCSLSVTVVESGVLHLFISMVFTGQAVSS